MAQSRPDLGVGIRAASSSSSTPARLFLSVIMLVLVGFVDAFTGYELQFFVFYFIPVVMVAWWGRSRVSVTLISVSAALLWFGADKFSGHQYPSSLYQYWNTGIRFSAFMMLGMAIFTVHRLLREETVLNAELRRTIEEIQQLRGLLPICASCKKIRNVEGYWEAVETYISAHSDAEFSHGICPECIERLYPEFANKSGEAERND